MDMEEARALLRKHLIPYREWTYDKLASLVGEEHVSEVTGDSGKRYFFQIDVEYVNETDDTLWVEGYVTEVEGRRWLPPQVNASFGVTRQNQVVGDTLDKL